MSGCLPVGLHTMSALSHISWSGKRCTFFVVGFPLVDLLSPAEKADATLLENSAELVRASATTSEKGGLEHLENRKPSQTEVSAQRLCIERGCIVLVDSLR